MLAVQLILLKGMMVAPQEPLWQLRPVLESTRRVTGLAVDEVETGRIGVTEISMAGEPVTGAGVRPTLLPVTLNCTVSTPAADPTCSDSA